MITEAQFLEAAARITRMDVEFDTARAASTAASESLRALLSEVQEQRDYIERLKNSPAMSGRGHSRVHIRKEIAEAEFKLRELEEEARVRREEEAKRRQRDSSLGARLEAGRKLLEEKREQMLEQIREPFTQELVGLGPSYPEQVSVPIERAQHAGASIFDNGFRVPPA